MALFDKPEEEVTLSPKDVGTNTPEPQGASGDDATEPLAIVFNEGIDELRKNELVPDGTYIAEVVRRSVGRDKNNEPYIIVAYKYVGVVVKNDEGEEEVQDPDEHLIGRTDDKFYSLVEGRRIDFFDLLGAFEPHGITPTGSWNPAEVIQPGLRFKCKTEGYRSKRGKNAGKFVVRMEPVNMGSA